VIVVLCRSLAEDAEGSWTFRVTPGGAGENGQSLVRTPTHPKFTPRLHNSLLPPFRCGLPLSNNLRFLSNCYQRPLVCRPQVVARSLVWPGASAISFGRRWAVVYNGDAVKYRPSPYIVDSPPQIQVWAP
jgi:hypothetical protein